MPGLFHSGHGFEESGKCVRRAAYRIGAERRITVSQVRRAQCLDRFAVNSGEPRLRHLRRREQAKPQIGVVAGKTRLQYRGHVKSGSRDTRLKFGLPDSATPTATQNTQAAFDYLWTKGYWKNSLTAGANYTRRFGNQNWRFQVNVTNLLNELDPIWGRSGLGFGAYNTATANLLNAGNPRTQFLYSFINPDPRKFTFTTTVSF